MKYKCLIVDDEALARELIQSYVSLHSNFEIVASCSTAMEAFDILKSEMIDLIFLDIEMPMLKGTDLIKRLKHKPNVILTTAFREYALVGYELNVIDYLLKPIVYDRFLMAIDKFISKVELPLNKKIFVYIKSNRRNIKILLDEVLFVESKKDYVILHKINESIQFKSKLSEFYKELDQRFLRVHRSFIVNTEKITAFSKTIIEINDLINIPIGEQYKESVNEALN